MSTTRRRKATQHLNTDLATLAEDEDSFKDVAFFLFGKSFEQCAKDHMESIKSLKTSLSTTGSYRPVFLGQRTKKVQAPDGEKTQKQQICTQCHVCKI